MGTDKSDFLVDDPTFCYSVADLYPWTGAGAIQNREFVVSRLNSIFVKYVHK